MKAVKEDEDEIGQDGHGRPVLGIDFGAVNPEVGSIRYQSRMRSNQSSPIASLHVFALYIHVQ